MSNLPFDPSTIPDYLRQAYGTSAVSNLLRGESIDRVSIRGRAFRLIEGGTEIVASAAPAMNFVLVAAAPKVSRTYYEGQYDESVKAAPVCWSSTGDAPDDAVPVAQRKSPNCAQCSMNVAGSGQKESRACRFQQRIAVALPDRLNKVYAMTIPATSLWGDKVQAGQPAPLTQYASFLAANRLPMEGVITEFSFDIQQTQPTLRFRVAGWLNQDQMIDAQELGDTDEAQAAIAFNVISREANALPAPTRAVIAPMPTTVIPQVQAMQQPQTIAQQPQFAPQQTASFGQMATAPAGFSAPQQQFAPQEQPTVTGGFAEAPPAAEAPKRTRRTREQIAAANAMTQTAAPNGFSAPTGFQPTAQVPNGFSAPAGFTAPAVNFTPPAGIQEPTVISTQQAAAQTGQPVEDIAALLKQWGGNT